MCIFSLIFIFGVFCLVTNDQRLLQKSSVFVVAFFGREYLHEDTMNISNQQTFPLSLGATLKTLKSYQEAQQVLARPRYYYYSPGERPDPDRVRSLWLGSLVPT
jgi:hypothetical protein